MAASKQNIRVWLRSEDTIDDARYMIVVCDTFDHDDYPVWVTAEGYADKMAEIKKADMQRVMEVYDLEMDHELQLAMGRVFNGPEVAA